MIQKRINLMVLMITCLAGLSDTATGLGLVIIPVQTLTLMGVSAGDYPVSMIRFIGAFVMGTGSLYLWGMFLFRRNRKWMLLELTWLTTGWLRMCVAVVTCFLILSKQLSIEWASVPLIDGMLALLQFGWIWLNKFPRDE